MFDECLKASDDFVFPNIFYSEEEDKVVTVNGSGRNAQLERQGFSL